MKRNIFRYISRLIKPICIFFLLSITTVGWSQNEVTELFASDAATFDGFGGNCSIDGDTAIISAMSNDDEGLSTGSAYIFQQDPLDPDSWDEIHKLLPEDAQAGARFGSAVSISSDFVIVGASAHDVHFTDTGAVYIFYRNQGGANEWGQVAKLTASDGAQGDMFGSSVSISGDVVIVGAVLDDDNGNISGSAYVFVKPSGGWEDMTQTAKLTASNGAALDHLGGCVSISGDTAVAGAWGDDDNGFYSGSAYVFVKDSGGWDDMTQTAKLTVSDGAASDRFGNSVSISGDVIIVGAWTDDDSGDGSGSAYVFVKDSGGWDDMTETGNLSASDGAAGDELGGAVSIRGDTVIVGAAFDDDNGSLSGSAYLFEKPSGGWQNATEDAKFTASNGEAGDLFGVSLSISGDYAIVGSVSSDNAPPAFAPGSAYVFDSVCPCPWDLDSTDQVDIFDLLDLLGQWGGDPGGPPDFDDDGDVDTTDLLALLANWGNCPCVEGP
ncbi:MAG: FG-GAP repeat protein [Planctomycetes bacterium]|nr:FG-GAP repeat protein [Planctomycetota bacterium]